MMDRCCCIGSSRTINKPRIYVNWAITLQYNVFGLCTNSFIVCLFVVVIVCFFFSDDMHDDENCGGGGFW